MERLDEITTNSVWKNVVKALRMIKLINPTGCDILRNMAMWVIHKIVENMVVLNFCECWFIQSDRRWEGKWIFKIVVNEYYWLISGGNGLVVWVLEAVGKKWAKKQQLRSLRTRWCWLELNNRGRMVIHMLVWVVVCIPRGLLFQGEIRFFSITNTSFWKSFPYFLSR